MVELIFVPVITPVSESTYDGFFCDGLECRRMRESGSDARGRYQDGSISGYPLRPIDTLDTCEESIK